MSATSTGENTLFYRDLPAVSAFSDLMDLNSYKQVPEDWYVLVADIEGSTQAIENNRYQDVNTLGASCIIAVLNACERLEIPYIFGGDGASLCVPPEYLEVSLAALKGTAAISEQAYNLKLRTGFVPVAVLTGDHIPLLVNKLQISPGATQASFTGGGLQAAENWIKQCPERYNIPDYIIANADFSGLQCRWDRIPSPKEETVSVLIEARCDTLEEQTRTYRRLMDHITEIYGSRDEHHPLQAEKMEMTYSKEKLASEHRLFTQNKSPIYKFWYTLKMRIIAAVGSFMMNRCITISGYNWGQYKRDMVANSDHRKFDDMLRMVLAGTKDQRIKLEACLKDEYEKGSLYYGTNVSTAALLTCLIFQSGVDHFHFVDGADGGYALAARQLKSQKSDSTDSGESAKIRLNT
ncbi:DUF3095 domain-containing protein [Oceanospirillum sediminis]|uniref:DUF3095 domain-containing protein n=1 Tax=Oceanospirillum sediminis TaxID=2760088 RepID=A0A839IYL7_9GAMM|nr:DUF3095 domain-containing protein [Oceanospirillum sediminis]MBB1489196.1 DUF3095 domain-containing protein [Oceanospirillum sediminis]